MTIDERNEMSILSIALFESTFFFLPSPFKVANFIKKLVSTFGVGLEAHHSVSNSFNATASEYLSRRAFATTEDPVFHKMKQQFATDFDFSLPGSQKLHRVISKLRKWTKILEAKIKLFPKSFLIEEKCRFLSNFTQSTAEVEIPGESLLPKHNNYYIRIARFMPRVEVGPLECVNM